jgi:sucrose-6-phosphate hydrolase SacC (GH32 family)
MQRLYSTARFGIALVAISMLYPSVALAERMSPDKTLLAWVLLGSLEQQGGSVLTIQSGEQFDAIVFGEKSRGRWMAGSDFFRRTQGDQNANAAETADARTLVQIAIVYTSDRTRLYRDGKLYAEYGAKNIDLLSMDNHIAVFGLRHVGAGTGKPFIGAVDDARIYDKALTPEQLAALKPNAASDPAPLAWWDFEGDKVIDRAGRFEHSAATGGVKVADGRLVLDGKGYLVAARSEADAKLATRAGNPIAPGPPYVPHTPAWPKNPPANWLTFHLAHPGPGNAYPGDPNCIFDYKGKYHLHYIYRDQTGFAFAHVTSDDMVRWTWQPTVLARPTTGHGMFSGTGFYTKEGKPAIIYHGEGSGRNWIQFAADDQLNSWTDPIVVLPKDAAGKVPNIRHWDPDCWLMGDTYYALSGGQNPQLMKSADLKEWTYLGDLLHKDYPANLGVPKNEDISCANIFRLGDKWMLLCISHRLGCRYYLGDFKDEKFLPQSHAMMSFGGNMFFAPESVLTRDGRRVMWAWLLNAPAAPTGIQSLPRELELPADGVLRIRPLRELATLRKDEKSWKPGQIKDGGAFALHGLEGDACELMVTFAAPLPRDVGLSLLDDGSGNEGVSIAANGKSLKIGSIEAPLELRKDEDLTLRVFIDKNLIEVFANDRQAMAFVHRHIRANPNVRLFAKGGDAQVNAAQAWKVQSIYADSKSLDSSAGERNEP